VKPSAQELEANKREVRVAGRNGLLSIVGKAGFAHLQGAGKKSRFMCGKDVVGSRDFNCFTPAGLGDSMACAGAPLSNQDHELSIWVRRFSFYRKPCCPTGKWHGLADVWSYATSYGICTIRNEKSRRVFETAPGLSRELRKFFDARALQSKSKRRMHPRRVARPPGRLPPTTITLDSASLSADCPGAHLKRYAGRGFEPRVRDHRNFRKRHFHAA